MPAQLVWVRTGLFVALGVAIAASAGCNSPAPCFPVSGKVTWQKKPMTTGVVTFTPDASKGNNVREGPMGIINPDGTYTLTSGGRNGAPLGWYKVSVSPDAPPSESATPEVKTDAKPWTKAAAKKSNFPAKFLRPETAGISIEVKENAPAGAYDIDLK